MATPTWAQLSVLLVDLLDAKGRAEIDMAGQRSRTKQYIRRKVITKWYNRHRFESIDIFSETRNGVVAWWTVAEHEEPEAHGNDR